MKLAYIDYVILLLLNLKLNIATLVMMLHPLYDLKAVMFRMVNQILDCYICINFKLSYLEIRVLCIADFIK